MDNSNINANDKVKVKIKYHCLFQHCKDRDGVIEIENDGVYRTDDILNMIRRKHLCVSSYKDVTLCFPSGLISVTENKLVITKTRLVEWECFIRPVQ